MKLGRVHHAQRLQRCNADFGAMEIGSDCVGVLCDNAAGQLAQCLQNGAAHTFIIVAETPGENPDVRHEGTCA